MEAVLPAPCRADRRPASRNRAEGGPERVLPFGIDQNPIVDLVAFERIRQTRFSKSSLDTDDNIRTVPMFHVPMEVAGTGLFPGLVA
jgi:hypothetical protein